MKIFRFFRSVYYDDTLRRERRAGWLPDARLYLRNRALQPLERRLVKRFRRDDLPVVFLVGAPRSGTTLLLQLMARYLEIGYVNNFMARYWMTPIHAARLWQRQRDASSPEIALQSNYGRAPGEEAPHEFLWFWKFFTEAGVDNDLSDEEVAAWPWDEIVGELQGLAGFFECPVVFKSLDLVNYQVEALHRHLPDARFLWLRRDPLFTAQSILQARRDRYGDEKLWWSVRPRDIEEWRDRPPAEQITHQIKDIDHALDEARAALPEEAFHQVDYEDLVKRPMEVLGEIADFCSTSLRTAQALEDLELRNANVQKVDEESFEALRRALGI